MSFLVAFKGQFSPLVTAVGSPVRNLIHPVSPLHGVSQTPEFREILGEVQHEQEPHQKVQPKLEAYKQVAKSFEETRKRIYAKDIMSFPAKLIPEASPAASAKELMTKYGFRHIPVINQANIITGLISDRELAIGSENKLCSEIMLQKVIVAEEHASINEIAIIFLKEKINALPIVDHNREVIGIITHSDILKYVIETTAFFGKA